MSKKNRKQKEIEYKEKFGSIPVDYAERLGYMYDLYGFENKPHKIEELEMKKNNMLNNLFYYDMNIVSLYEIPEGTGRPRFRLINRKNYNMEAISNGNFVHVYTIGAKDDFLYMQRMVNEGELMQLSGLVCTPCIMDYYAYFPTPSSYSDIDKCLAEIGLIRPSLAKPDWDNIGKKYCDMYNYNIWLDDATVNDGYVHKYYSILPRIEIRMRYLNCVYNRNQYNNIIRRKNYDGCQLSYLDSKGVLVNGQKNEGVIT